LAFIEIWQECYQLHCMGCWMLVQPILPSLVPVREGCWTWRWGLARNTTQVVKSTWWLFKNAHSAKTVFHVKFVAALAFQHHMIVGNYIAQGQYVGNLMWMNPYKSMNRQVPNEVCCCCTCIAVNVHGFIELPDVGQQLGIVEYINSGLIVEEDPRTGDPDIVDEEWKLKVWAYIRVTMLAYVEIVESSVSCGIGHRSCVFFTGHWCCRLGCWGAWALAIWTLIIEMANFLAIKPSHCCAVMTGSWCSSMCKCKAIIESANHIHYVPRVIFPPGYKIICIH